MGRPLEEAADKAEQRRIWESRCPFLLTKCDELEAKVAAQARVISQACMILGTIRPLDVAEPGEDISIGEAAVRWRTLVEEMVQTSLGREWEKRATTFMGLAADTGSGPLREAEKLVGHLREVCDSWLAQGRVIEAQREALRSVRNVFPEGVCSECAGFEAEVFEANRIIDAALAAGGEIETPERDKRVPFCEGGSATCEVCVGSCGIEEYEAR